MHHTPFAYAEQVQDSKERLQKLLSRAGVASRRHSEEFIRAGRVTINGQVAKLGDSANPNDDIRLDNKRIQFANQHVTFALYKPFGIVVSNDDELGRQNVMELLPQVPGLHSVGRLDKDSEGLLLLTTDGDLTLQLTHPRYGHEKQYRVWTEPFAKQTDMEKLVRGVTLEDGPAHAVAAELAPGGALITLNEGRKRQLRRMCESLELEVVRLLRVRVGPLEIGDLKEYEWRELTHREVEMLRSGAKPAQLAGGPKVLQRRKAKPGAL